jgi:hypothetical protein
MEFYYWNAYTYRERHNNDQIIKNINIKTVISCFTVEQQRIHETAGLFPVFTNKNPVL